MGLYSADEFFLAIVKRFFTSDDKLYGFAHLEWPMEGVEGDVYFQWHTGKRPETRGSVDDIELLGRPPHYPECGDRIVLRLSHGAKGPRAVEWMFEDELKLVRSGGKLSFTFDEAEFHLCQTNRAAIEDRRDGLADVQWMFEKRAMASGCFGVPEPYVHVFEYGNRAATTFNGGTARRFRFVGHSGEYHRVGGGY